MNDEIDFENEQDDILTVESAGKFSDAVLYSSDWTVETILSQLRRENIQLNPNFQRRDAWSNSRKSRFIESLIVGLPVPQLVLAEAKSQRGRYLVLDGKQRLLSLLRFSESGEDRSKGFGLSGLEIRNDLSRKKFYHFENDVEFADDLNAFSNYTIRTVIIRNWPNSDFLHQVFLRLNTGSVKLSPQELRQAMAPGPFTTFADDYSADSTQIQKLLGRNTPDPRMRDVELLVRHIAFSKHINSYPGRMKVFLDDVCTDENNGWSVREGIIRNQAEEFDKAISVLFEILGERIARKPDSRSFNRAIFDALAFYASDRDIRDRMNTMKQSVAEGYDQIFEDREFLESIESDTAGVPNTVTRLSKWGAVLSKAIGIKIRLPSIVDNKVRF